MTVRSATVRAVEIVPERPVETAAGSLNSVPLVLIDLQTREGVLRRSYVRCYTPLALRATVRLIEDLAAPEPRLRQPALDAARAGGARGGRGHRPGIRRR
jgi:mandelate racemase